ncbi:hypothetical protein [Vibrio mediterranei]|uniref:Uncharacterized protein n=1 Tax=Vibrio mediterranei TaxID=689 RepID=A0ABX5D8A6_9VIBR|nr:hypothetical protein [Vibrio mediterranei]PRQ65177.1 hypothetical protein COR51_23945 [Vibrio mediterranei]
MTRNTHNEKNLWKQFCEKTKFLETQVGKAAMVGVALLMIIWSVYSSMTQYNSTNPVEPQSSSYTLEE